MGEQSGMLRGEAIVAAEELEAPVTIGAQAYISPEYARAERDRLSEFSSGWERQRRTLRDGGWREEGITAVEKLAQERGIPDLEVAAAFFEKQNPPAQPVIGVF